LELPGDTFGSKFATTNAGLLYTAKGTASFLVPVASLISAAYGWSAVFAIIIGLNIVAAILAMFVLKPLRARYLADDVAAAAPSPDSAFALSEDAFEPPVSAGGSGYTQDPTEQLKNSWKRSIKCERLFQQEDTVLRQALRSAMNIAASLVFFKVFYSQVWQLPNPRIVIYL